MERKSRKCKGHKTNGEPCPNWAMHGQLVCHAHGGRAPQAKSAAGRRLAIEHARRLVDADGIDMDPIEYLIDSLRRAYQWMRVWGQMVGDLDERSEMEHREHQALRGSLNYREPSESARKRGDELTVFTNERLLGFNYRGEAQIHPFVEQYTQALERVAKFAKLALDAGVDQIRVELEAKQVDAAVRAFEAMLQELGLSQDQKQEARQTYARHLRAV